MEGHGDKAPRRHGDEEGMAGSGHRPGAMATSPLQAWCHLVWLCLERQAHARQMVWIALALLVVTTTVIALVTASGRWGVERRKWVAQDVRAGYYYGPVDDQALRSAPTPMRRGPGLSPARPKAIVLDYDETAGEMEVMPHAGPWPAPAVAVQHAVAAACRAVLDRSGFLVFSNWIVYAVFISFLLPIWSVSFATDALGGERESGTLVWLLTRPLPRSAIYLAKFLAVLPWSLGLNLGGFGLLCLAAGRAGQPAFRWHWPAVLLGTVAFCALFQFLGAWSRRPAVVAIVYCFFLETLVGNMPGYMKRISITFYTRCLMYSTCEAHGVLPPETPSVYLPVDGATACWVLGAVTALLLLVGMVVFARFEYQELS